MDIYAGVYPFIKEIVVQVAHIKCICLREIKGVEPYVKVILQVQNIQHRCLYLRKVEQIPAEDI